MQHEALLGRERLIGSVAWNMAIRPPLRSALGRIARSLRAFATRRLKIRPARRVEPRDSRHEGCLTCLAALTHQFSQPFTALQGSLELAMLTEGSVEDYHKAIQVSFEEAERLAHLIRSVREWLESGDVLLAGERVSLGDLLHEVVENVRAFAGSREVTLDVRLEGNPSVRGEPPKLERAILHAVHQAIQRSPSCSTVMLSLKESKGFAYLVITDHGEILSAEDRDACLNPYLSGRVPSQPTAAAGLEWAIAKRIIEAHGGAVQVEGGANRESRFRIGMPLA